MLSSYVDYKKAWFLRSIRPVFWFGFLFRNPIVHSGARPNFYKSPASEWMFDSEKALQSNASALQMETAAPFVLSSWN